MLQHQSIIVYKKQIELGSNGINPQDNTQITKKEENLNIIPQLPQRKIYHAPDDFLIDLQSRIKKGALPSLKQYRPIHHSPDSNTSTINIELNHGNQRKLYNIQSTHKKPFVMSPILKMNDLQSEDNTFTPQILSSRKKPSLLNSNLKLIRRNQLIFNKESVNQLQSKTQIDAFWITKCIPVKIIRTESQQPCLQIQKDGVVKIYGKLIIKFFSYIVISSSCDSTLQSQIQQFGECTEKLIWKYIKNIIKGLMQIHSRGGSFNILTLNRILLDFQGNTYIDISKCKFSYSISNEDKKNQFYYLSPQILIGNRDSPKNDVWSLGCIILSLMLGKRIDDDIQLHPYNYKETDKQSMNEKQLEIMEKIDKIKKLKKFFSLKDKANNQSTQNTGKLRGNSYNKNNLSKQLQKKYSLNDNNKKEGIIIQITQQLFCLMQDCLQIQQYKRPSFEELIRKYESLRQ